MLTQSIHKNYNSTLNKGIEGKWQRQRIGIIISFVHISKTNGRKL